MDPGETRRLLADWRHGDGALYVELAASLASLIEAGHIASGTVLAPERRLADELGVSRNTIVAAYNRLRQDGLVRSRQGSGTVVVARDVLSPRAARIAGSLTPNGVFDGFLAPQHDAIDLRAGYWVGTDDLPPDVFDLASDLEHRRLVAGPGYHPWGLEPLRAAIASRLTRQGLATEADQLLITTGAQQAIALLVSLLIDPGDVVLVEESTYPGVLDVLRAYGAQVHAVRRDVHGPDPLDVRRARRQLDPRLAYLVLSGHNPTGSIAPAPVRAALAREVNEGLVVIDDVSLADTTAAEVPPPLAGFVDDTAKGHVITVGSLSKAVWGGLRIGWLRAPHELLPRLLHLKTIHDIGTPASSQLLAVRIMNRLPEILDRRHAAIVARRDLLESELRGRIPQWTWQTPAAGLSLWIDLGGVNGVDFAAHATRYGIELAPGTISSPAGAYAGRLRIPFGQPETVLEEAVTRIAAAWENYCGADSPSDRLRMIL